MLTNKITGMVQQGICEGEEGMREKLGAIQRFDGAHNRHQYTEEQI